MKSLTDFILQYFPEGLIHLQKRKWERNPGDNSYMRLVPIIDLNWFTWHQRHLQGLSFLTWSHLVKEINHLWKVTGLSVCDSTGHICLVSIVIVGKIGLPRELYVPFAKDKTDILQARILCNANYDQLLSCFVKYLFRWFSYFPIHENKKNKNSQRSFFQSFFELPPEHQLFPPDINIYVYLYWRYWHPLTTLGRALD